MHRHWRAINLSLLALGLVLTGQDIVRWLTGDAPTVNLALGYPLLPLIFVVCATAILVALAGVIWRLLSRP